jgi:hypothetical protein
MPIGSTSNSVPAGFWSGSATLFMGCRKADSCASPLGPLRRTSDWSVSFPRYALHSEVRLINKRQLPMLHLAPARDRSRNPFSTMKWFNRTAEVSAGSCREAAIYHSPGVREIQTRALPVRHSFASSSEAGKVAPDVCETGGVNTRFPERTPRSPLSGRFNASTNPGLKPWAILSDHFMVKNWPRSVNISNHSNA